MSVVLFHAGLITNIYETYQSLELQSLINIVSKQIFMRVRKNCILVFSSMVL